MMQKLSWARAMAWRTRRQHLAGRVPRARMLEVARVLCGLHAQLMSSAELSLWARVDGVRREDVQAALWERRSLVKTWAMRGTLHLLPADEYGTWQAGLGLYRHYLQQAWFRGFGVTRDELEALLAAVRQALDGNVLTREELAVGVGRITGSPRLAEKVRGSWGAFLKPAAFRGHLCFGPSNGQQVTFTRPDDWLTGLTPVEPNAAMPEIYRRFIGGHGPVDLDDLVRWWRLSAPATRKHLTALDEDVAGIEVEGRPMIMLATDIDEAANSKPSRTVRLLPAFDPYVSANPRQAENLMAGDFKARVYRPQAYFAPVLLVNGRMDGTWRHQRKGKFLDVTIEPFDTVARWARVAAEAEAERLADFLDGSLRLSWAA